MNGFEWLLVIVGGVTVVSMLVLGVQPIGWD